MNFRFRIVSDEVEDFIREIRINADATFYDLHVAILKAVNYKDDQLTSFFICNEDWEKQTEITLEEMNFASDVDIYLMRNTALSDLLEDEHERLLYCFDPLSDRHFFMELCEITYGKPCAKATCTRKMGDAPAQTIDFDEVLKATSSLDIDENFYGDQDFDLDEIDREGFDMGEGGYSSCDSLDSDCY